MSCRRRSTRRWASNGATAADKRRLIGWRSGVTEQIVVALPLKDTPAEPHSMVRP